MTGTPEVPGYEVLDEVGRGGFATVYRARQLSVDRLVALKVLTHVAADERTRHRFLRECRAMGRLSWHANIVVVHDAGTTEAGVPYLAMELLEGGSLAERVARRGPIPWGEAVPRAAEVADALASAHEAEVLHRDVKPENVLVGRAGQAKLGDFGIAGMRDGRATTTGTVTATLAHAAPEVLDGSAAGERSDVYSLGSTLFELLRGRPAFVEETDESLLAVVRRVAEDPVPDLSPQGVPAPVSAAVAEAMAKDPADRPASAAELAARLRAALEEAGRSTDRAGAGSDARLTVVLADLPSRGPAGAPPPTSSPNDLGAPAGGSVGSPARAGPLPRRTLTAAARRRATVAAAVLLASSCGAILTLVVG